MGCGKESRPGNCNTPGWALRNSDTIDYDTRGFKKLLLKRNHTRLLQTSLNCLQSWRANCDVSILIYESDPEHPDASEIAKVTDYVVNYACKGNTSLAIERKQVKEFTLNCEAETGDEKDVIKTVQKCLNRSVSNRTITKQEAVCQLGKLPLVICSETIDTVSLSGVVRVTNGTNSTYKTFLSKYNTRTTHLDKSLHQFFHLTKNHIGPSKKRKEVVPHYVGGGGQPTYPVSKKYARTEMLKYIPWSKNNPLPEMNDTTTLELFDDFMKSEHCPLSIPIELERAKNRIEMRKRGISEPTNDEITESQELHCDIDDETRELINITNNLVERSNIFETLENEGFDIGRNYNWCNRLNKVSEHNVLFVAIERYVFLLECIV
jgi:hypothetical protein